LAGYGTRVSEVVRWNSFSRVNVGPSDLSTPSMWGPSSETPSSVIEQRGMAIDGSAGTSMYCFDGDFGKLDFLRYDVTNLAYYIRHTGRTAVIGVGGGRDILSAHFFGFQDITGVELNPIFIDMLSRVFLSYNHLADLPGTRLFVDEARSWFARSVDHFDSIEMSLVDTWAATGAGAFSLSENGLYTLQGWRTFFDHLAPSGVFTVSRWYSPGNVNETGRMLSLAMATLMDEHISNPREHIFLAAVDNLATLIVSRAPFTPAELATLTATTNSLRFTILFSPAITYHQFLYLIAALWPRPHGKSSARQLRNNLSICQRQQMTGPSSSTSSGSRTLRRFGSPSIRNPAWGGAI